jgi:hypothetical protein
MRVCQIQETYMDICEESLVDIFLVKFLYCCISAWLATVIFIPYPKAFPYGNGMVLQFYQQQESSTTKTVHKVINKGLKTYVYSLHTGENFH